MTYQYRPTHDNAGDYTAPADDELKPAVVPGKAFTYSLRDLSANGQHQAQQDLRLDVLEAQPFTVAAILAAVGACREELAAVRPVPTALDSILFAMTELAEYVEAARLRPNAQYIRNNERQFDERRELAQVGEMLATAMWVMDTEPTSKDAGGILVGRLAGAIAYALGMWSQGKRSAAWASLETALTIWAELCGFVDEDPVILIQAETARLRGKFGAK